LEPRVAWRYGTPSREQFSFRCTLFARKRRYAYVITTFTALSGNSLPKQR
jgi:hypothetical protein